ncbi:MAG: hypothetical protein Q4D02_04060 [Clostridia bacterium]|nr:hypothetical protein [Clostridia bacterium]
MQTNVKHVGKGYVEEESFAVIGGEKSETIGIERYENGILWIDKNFGVCGATIGRWAEIVSGMFAKEANFEREIQRVFGSSTPLHTVIFYFNRVKVSVNKEHSSPKEIVALWESNFYKPKKNYHEAANSLKEKLESIIYSELSGIVDVGSITKEDATLSKDQLDLLEKCIQKLVTLKKAEAIFKYTEMEFESELSKQEFYSMKDASTLKFAVKWAKAMQYLMQERDESARAVGQEASKMADPDVPFYVEEIAKSYLKRCWKYGNSL